MPQLELSIADTEVGWSIIKNGKSVEVIRSHYDAYEVLLQAERYADGQVIAWRLDGDGGFQAVLVP